MSESHDAVVIRNQKTLNMIVVLAHQLDADVCDHEALWDDAQDHMEKFRPAPQNLDEMAETFQVLANRAKERAEDVRNELEATSATSDEPSLEIVNQ